MKEKTEHPFYAGTFSGMDTFHQVAADRLSIVRTADPVKLQAILALPDLQKSVRAAAEHRLFKFQRQALASTATALRPSAQDRAADATLGAPGLSDDLLEEIHDLINASIHELVFAAQHLDQTSAVPGADCTDDIESAQDCLTTVGMNVDRIQEMLLAAKTKGAS